MKTKFILLCTFFLFSSWSVNAQVDTIAFLNAYADAEYDLVATLQEELDKQGTLTIEKYGRFSSPFSEAMENTLIRFALQNKETVELRLEYYDLGFSSRDKKEEYYLQRTITENYPDQLMDFLQLKMTKKEPIVFKDFKNTSNSRRSLPDDLEARYQEVRKLKPLVTTRQDVEVTSSTTFINGISLHDIRYPELQLEMTEDCECSYWRCFFACLDIENDVLEGTFWTICSNACYPAPFNPVCGVCVYLIVPLGIEYCEMKCEADPCSDYYVCTPGTENPDDPAYCTGGNKVRRSVCKCDGLGYETILEDCSPGFCENGECLPCKPEEGPVRPHIPHTPQDQEGGQDRLEESEGQSREAYRTCDRNLKIALIELNHESTPGSHHGSIHVRGINGYGNDYADDDGYTYEWDNGLGSHYEISGLSAGTYCVTVVDDRCCHATACYTLVEEYCENTPWGITDFVTHACNGNDGKIWITNVTEAPQAGQDYEYQWSTGYGGDGSSFSTLSNLAPGAYQVTITGQNGCATTKEYLVYGYDNSEGEIELEAIIIGICPSDPNSNTGEINLYYQSLMEMLSYKWEDANGNTVYTGEDPVGLIAGVYTVTAIDECGGTHTASFEIGTMEASVEVLHNNVAGLCEGEIELTVTAGKLPLSVTMSGPSGTSMVSLTSYTHTFTDLCTGDYQIEISDANNECTIPLSANVCDCPGIVFGEWVHTGTDQSLGMICKPYSLPASSLCEAVNDEICFVPTPGTFMYVDGQYCRNLYCPTGEDCGDYDDSLQECFTPTYTEWDCTENLDNTGDNICCRDAECTTGAYYCNLFGTENECPDYYLKNCTVNDDYKCECEVWVNDEFINQYREREPIVTWVYDEDENKCIKIMSCSYIEEGSDVEDTCIHDPIDYGDWEFDTGNEICIREVICSDDNSLDAEQIENNPEVEWEFDEGEQACIAHVYCEEGFFSDLDVEGETEYEWGFYPPSSTSSCVAMVSCGFNGNFQEVTEYEQPYQVENWEIITVSTSTDDYYCQINITCGEDGFMSSYSSGIELIDEYTEDGIEYCELGCSPQDVPGTTLVVACDLLDFTDDGTVRFLTDNIDEIYAYENSKKAKLKAAVSVRPNPFKEQIQIDALPTSQGALAIDIVNSQGMLIEHIPFELRTELVLNTEKWPTGIYFMQIYNQTKTYTQSKKVIKID